MEKRTVLVWKDPGSLSIATAHYFVTESNRCIGKKGRFIVALSGGNTPKKVYELLASPEFSHNIPWKNVFLFWGDERFVPPDSLESNYHMVKESLLEHIHIPDKNIFPIPTTGTPKQCARQYEKSLRRFFKGHQPRFDFLLSGAGIDGHTASLFPGTRIINEKKRWIREVKQPETNADRISFTLPLINKARQIIFLVSGNEKAEVVAKALSKKETKILLPVQLVQPAKGKVLWMLDEQAATLLRPHALPELIM